MPRDGLQQYAPPPGTQGVANYTVESARYNTFVADITADQNNPRPIVAGGTGASSGPAALVNLGGENASQLVDNYDTFPFVAGSFHSLAGATSAPNSSNIFAGICYLHDNGSITLEARIQGPATTTANKKYVRQKWSTWSPWFEQAGGVADLDAAYVNVAGDTMTGRLDITMPDPALALNKAGSGHVNAIYGAVGANARWLIQLGNATAEGGSNAGSDFVLTRYNDAGAVIASPLTIQRSSGVAFFEGTVTTPGSFTCGGPVIAGNAGVGGTYYFGNSGTESLNYDGANYNLIGGTNLNLSANLQCSGNIGIGSGSTTGGLFFGNTGTKFLNYDGTNFNLSGGGLYLGNADLHAGDIYGGRSATVGYHFFGTGNTKYLGYDGATFQFVGGTVNVNSGNLSIQTPPGAPTAPPVGYGISMVYGGTTQFGMGLRAMNDASGFNAISFLNSGAAPCGGIVCTSTTTSYSTSSSAELKEDLKSFDAGNIIDSTEVYDFKWRSTGERAYGVIAQQAVEVYPTAVTHTINPENKDDEFWGVDYSKYVPVLLQELKALRTRVAELEGRVLTKPAP